MYFASHWRWANKSQPVLAASCGWKLQAVVTFDDDFVSWDCADELRILGINNLRDFNSVTRRLAACRRLLRPWDPQLRGPWSGRTVFVGWFTSCETALENASVVALHACRWTCVWLLDSRPTQRYYTLSQWTGWLQASTACMWETRWKRAKHRAIFGVFSKCRLRTSEF